MVTLADRSTELNPDFLSEVVLYAVSAADLTMLVVLVFVLARNIVKLIVERRRGLPFSRFRAKLVLAMLGLTIVPSVLVLIVGGELIRSSTERWLRVPIDDVLRLSTQIAGDYYREREARVEVDAARIAAAVPAVALAVAMPRRFGARSPRRLPRVASRSSRSIASSGNAGASPRWCRLSRCESPTLSATGSHAERRTNWRRGCWRDRPTPQTFEPLEAGSELVRAGAVIRERDGAVGRRGGRQRSSVRVSSPRTRGASPRPTRSTTRSRS